MYILNLIRLALLASALVAVPLLAQQEPPDIHFEHLDGREYLEFVCENGSPVFRKFMYGDMTPFEKYKGYQAVRIKIDQLKDVYPDYQHKAYVCVGAKLELEGQIFGYYLRGIDYFIDNAYKGGYDFVYSDFRQDNFDRAKQYYQRALEMVEADPENRQLDEAELMWIGSGMYASPEHSEAQMRAKLESIAGLSLIGEGSEHPMRREEYEVKLYYGAASGYAQNGQFDDAARLLDELAALSDEGAAAVPAMRAELAEAQATWSERQAEQEARLQDIRDRTGHLQPLIWALAESEDGVVTDDMLALVKQPAADNNAPASKADAADAQRQKTNNNAAASPLSSASTTLWYWLAGAGLLLIAVFTVLRR